MKNSLLSKIFILTGVILLLLALILGFSNRKTEEEAFIEIEKAKEEAEEELKEANEDSLYLGIIKIPSLGTELPVFKEFSEEKLDIAPCLQKGSLSEKAVISGHNFKGHFDTLHEMTSGEEAVITTSEGEIFNYRLKEMLKIKPTDIEKVMETDYPLVIYTCNYSGKARLAFYFERA